MAAVKNSRINRSTGTVDFSLLTDGLRAEREQGITIDVAYRYFETPRRKFIIADTPGHEQYTRNMATGASTANLAVTLSIPQKAFSRRHGGTLTFAHCSEFQMCWLRLTKWISWSTRRRFVRLQKILKSWQSNWPVRHVVASPSARRGR